MKSSKKPKKAKRGSSKTPNAVVRSKTFLSTNAITKQVRDNSVAHLARLTELLEEKLQDEDVASESAHEIRVGEYRKLMKLLIEGGSFDVGEARVLENYRKRCGISEEEHESALRAAEVSEQTLNVFAKARMVHATKHSHYSLARGAMQYLGGENAKKTLRDLQSQTSTLLVDVKRIKVILSDTVHKNDFRVAILGAATKAELNHLLRQLEERVIQLSKTKANKNEIDKALRRKVEMVDFAKLSKRTAALQTQVHMGGSTSALAGVQPPLPQQLKQQQPQQLQGRQEQQEHHQHHHHHHQQQQQQQQQQQGQLQFQLSQQQQDQGHENAVAVVGASSLARNWSMQSSAFANHEVLGKEKQPLLKNTTTKTLSPIMSPAAERPRNLERMKGSAVGSAATSPATAAPSDAESTEGRVREVATGLEPEMVAAPTNATTRAIGTPSQSPLPTAPRAVSATSLITEHEMESKAELSPEEAIQKQALSRPRQRGSVISETVFNAVVHESAEKQAKLKAKVEIMEEEIEKMREEVRTALSMAKSANESAEIASKDVKAAATVVAALTANRAMGNSPHETTGDVMSSSEVAAAAAAAAAVVTGAASAAGPSQMPNSRSPRRSSLRSKANRESDSDFDDDDSDLESELAHIRSQLQQKALKLDVRKLDDRLAEAVANIEKQQKKAQVLQENYLSLNSVKFKQLDRMLDDFADYRVKHREALDELSGSFRTCVRQNRELQKNFAILLQSREEDKAELKELKEKHVEMTAAFLGMKENYTKMLRSHQGWHSKLESTQGSCVDLSEELRNVNFRLKDFVQQYNKKDVESSETIKFLQRDVSAQKQRLKERHAVLMQRQDMLHQAVEGLRDSCHSAIDQMSTELSLCQGNVEFTKSRLDELGNPIHIALHDAQLENRSLVDELERRYPRHSFWSKSGKEFARQADERDAVERGVSAPPGLPSTLPHGVVGKVGAKCENNGVTGQPSNLGTAEAITPFPPPSRGSLRTAPAGRERGGQRQRSGSTNLAGRTSKRKHASAARRRKRGPARGGSGSDQHLGRWLADVGGAKIAL